ncbi:2-oxoglutarate-dependent ethylene succinate-forming enzyme [Fusarium beomiforme]|uniref:2-oxoglutarate-dependent ethylene succinate-forming enzyme n=1 Tax=Fusarium beomiforme TaxID=44412 RepID=A0A9P5APF3_9HYPO|nr:2-oxoglutarate-dependent ethylene succinate-forming enzyme [Fusarium beomiforme]
MPSITVHNMSTAAAAAVAPQSHTPSPLNASGPPPGHSVTVGNLQTFVLPNKVSNNEANRKLGKTLIEAWQKDGILQISMTSEQYALYKNANCASKRFFRKPYAQKAACIDSQTYSGYIASGEELTDGIADYSEIFTVTKDLELDEPRVVAKWPCHGRCPWPDYGMQNPMQRYMQSLGTVGETLLQLTELGLNVPEGSLTNYTQDGWHHLRILRFPAINNTNGKGKKGRGIGSHTDYGLLVIAAADDVGGDMMQYMTNSALPSTPHKVGLNLRERFAFAYFHEPSFQAVVKPLPGYDVGQEPKDGIHYGKHFTNMFMRNYPQRITTQRMNDEGRYELLEQESLQTMAP